MLDLLHRFGPAAVMTLRVRVSGPRLALLVVVFACLAAAAVAQRADGAFRGANGKVVFQRGPELWTMNPDGTAQTSLSLTTTIPNSANLDPRWSPNGQRIVFASTGPNPGEETPLRITLVNPDGTGFQQLPQIGRAPAWSPDGGRIVRTSNNQLAVMNADGTGDQSLGTPGADPEWSPDGLKIAFHWAAGVCDPSCKQDVFTITPDGTGLTNVTNSPTVIEAEPSWSPDGRKIAFTKANICAPLCAGEIWVMNANGSGQTQLTSSPTTDESNTAWSPDGTQIVFESWDPAHSVVQISRMRADGTGRTPVTEPESSSFGFAPHPDWQPLPIVPYDQPQSASPVSVSLVPVFRQCGIPSNQPNGQHAAPLAVPACTGPQPTSPVARIGANYTGSLQLSTVAGDTDATNGDQADVAVSVHLTDVQTPAGGDYDPNPASADLTAAARVRITDRNNNYGGASGTASELFVLAPVDCVATAGAEGSACDVTTTYDALVPGAIEENRGTVAQVFRVHVLDSGPNGVRESGGGDDVIFVQQGVYVP